MGATSTFSMAIIPRDLKMAAVFCRSGSLAISIAILLASSHPRNRWQIEAELIIVGHGGCGSEARRAQVVSTPTPYASSMPCAIPVSANRNPRE